jgi:hypothetical protein
MVLWYNFIVSGSDILNLKKLKSIVLKGDGSDEK